MRGTRDLEEIYLRFIGPSSQGYREAAAAVDPFDDPYGVRADAVDQLLQPREVSTVDGDVDHVQVAPVAARLELRDRPATGEVPQ